MSQQYYRLLRIDYWNRARYHGIMLYAVAVVLGVYSI